MFNARPVFLRFNRYRQHAQNSGGWMLVMPGLLLVFFALTILVWPELLAYIVATALLMAGVSLTTWGWSMRKLQNRQRQGLNARDVHDTYTSDGVHYRVR